MNWLKILLEPHVLAVLVSLIATWGATETVKRIVRSTASRRDDWTPRAIAFLSGLGFGWATWPADTLVEPWVFGMAVGFSAPLIHWATVVVIRWKWPELAKRMTGRPS